MLVNNESMMIFQRLVTPSNVFWRILTTPNDRLLTRETDRCRSQLVRRDSSLVINCFSDYAAAGKLRSHRQALMKFYGWSCICSAGWAHTSRRLRCCKTQLCQLCVIPTEELGSGAALHLIIGSLRWYHTRQFCSNDIYVFRILLNSDFGFIGPSFGGIFWNDLSLIEPNICWEVDWSRSRVLAECR